MKRCLRRFLLVACAVVITVWGGAATAATGSIPARQEGHVVHAFSLRVAQQRLAGAPPGTPPGREIRHLGGLTKIYGYVVDASNHDLVVFGIKEPGAPSLYLEDLVVALRNARKKYAVQKGNTYYYSHPGCSIDPDPETYSRLNEVSQRINQLTGRQGSREAVSRELQHWHQVCRAPQTVRVLGIPFHTRFAWVMVKADYDMKQLVSGADDPGIQGFQSLTGRKMDLAQEAIQANQPISIPLSTINRFWFYPGQELYKEDTGVVEITQCPVILLTEEEVFTKTKKIVGTGMADPRAEEFTKQFSSHYRQIAQKRPIYAELEGLFRFVALSQIITKKHADREAGLDLGYLLNQFPVPEVKVRERLSGRSHIPEFEHKQEIEGGYSIVQLWLPSCGGVTIDLDVSPLNFRSDPSGTLNILRQRVIDSRPSPEQLFWDTPFRRPLDEVRLPHDARQLARLRSTD